MDRAAEFLRLSVGHCAIGLVEYSCPSLGREFLSALPTAYGVPPTARIDIDEAAAVSKAHGTVLDQIVSEGTAYLETGLQGLIVTGLDRLLVDSAEVAGTPIELVPVLQPLNLGRSALASTLRAPIILCLPSRAMRVLLAGAPDFKTWASCYVSLALSVDPVLQQVRNNIAAVSRRDRWLAYISSQLGLPSRIRTELESRVVALGSLLEDARYLGASPQVVAGYYLSMGDLATIARRRTDARFAYNEALRLARDHRLADTQLRQRASEGYRDADKIPLQRIRQSPSARPQLWGPRPRIRRDQLEGRERDVLSIVGHLRDLRFVTLWGESGVGKSSLILAGVKPELESRGYAVIVIRQWHTWSRDFLAAMNATLDLSLSASQDPLDALDSALQRTSRRLVIVCDQFEDVFGWGVPLPTRWQIIRFVTGIVNNRGLRCSVLFSIRQDDLWHLLELEPTLREPLQEQHRHQLAPLSRVDALRLLKRFARESSLAWTDTLVLRLVNNLASAGRLTALQLQLAAEALALSGIVYETDYDAAGGADGLLREYIPLHRARLIRAGTTRRQLDTILGQLIRDDGSRSEAKVEDLLRRCPKAVSSLFRPARHRATVLSALRSLEEAGLVERRAPASSEWQGSDVVVLTHDALGPLVKEATWEASDAEKRANAIIRRGLKAGSADPGYRLRFREAWRARRRASQDVRSIEGAERLISQSLGRGARSIALWVSSLLVCVVALQSAFSYLTVESDFARRVVTNRGLPWLAFLPWSGSRRQADLGLVYADLKRDRIQAAVNKVLVRGFADPWSARIGSVLEYLEPNVRSRIDLALCTSAS